MASIPEKKEINKTKRMKKILLAKREGEGRRSLTAGIHDTNVNRFVRVLNESNDVRKEVRRGEVQQISTELAYTREQQRAPKRLENSSS